MKEAKVKGSADLVKDLETGVVKNKNQKAFQAARARKKMVEDQLSENTEKESKIEKLEKELKETKKLVKDLVKDLVKKTKE